MFHTDAVVSGLLLWLLLVGYCSRLSRHNECAMTSCTAGAVLGRAVLLPDISIFIYTYSQLVSLYRYRCYRHWQRNICRPIVNHPVTQSIQQQSVTDDGLVLTRFTATVPATLLHRHTRFAVSSCSTRGWCHCQLVLR